MYSRCCKAHIQCASALYSQLECDFYICSQCGFDCDIITLTESIKHMEGISMSNFDEAVNYVLGNEKGLEVNPRDPGGITKYGISFRFLKALSPETLRKYGLSAEITPETIRNLTIDQAKEIYKGEFWDHAPFAQIGYQNHCNYLFDMAVNMGISPAIKCIQRSCWAVMKQWDKLPDDGILGAQTLAAIKQCGFLIMPAMRAERGSYYRMCVNANPEMKEDLNGWFNRTYNTL